MRVLDIDMDYFVYNIAQWISQDSELRLSDKDYPVWERNDVIAFLEQNLGLRKDQKIRGKIVQHHFEVLYYWRQLITGGELQTPFEVIHVDSHADLGLGSGAWVFIFEKLLGIDVSDRAKVETYKERFSGYKEPSICDFLLFAIAFRWISKITYIHNPKLDYLDYLPYILKGCVEPNDTIQLPHNTPAYDMNDKIKRRVFLAKATLEPEVKFEAIKELKHIKYNGDFEFLTLSISPNYTPESADFIIDIINEYISE